MGTKPQHHYLRESANTSSVRIDENMNSHGLIQPMQGERMYAVIVPCKFQPLSL